MWKCFVRVIYVYPDLGVSCPPVPSIHYAEPDSSSRSVGTSVDYVCASPLTFDNGHVTHRETCSEYGVWEPGILPSCVGKTLTSTCRMKKQGF